MSAAGLAIGAGPALYGFQRGQDDTVKLNEELANSRLEREARTQSMQENAALAPLRRRALESTISQSEAAAEEIAANAPLRRQATQMQFDTAQIGMDQARLQAEAQKNGQAGSTAIQKLRATGDPQHVADYFNEVNKRLGVPDHGWTAAKDESGAFVLTDKNGRTMKMGQETWPDGRKMTPMETAELHIHATSDPTALGTSLANTQKFHERMAEDMQKQANQMAIELVKTGPKGKSPEEVRLAIWTGLARNPMFGILPKDKQDEMVQNAIGAVQGGGSMTTGAPRAQPPSEIDGAKVVNDPKLGWIATKDGKTYRVNPPAGAQPAQQPAAAPAAALPVSAPAAAPAVAAPAVTAAPPAALPVSQEPAWPAQRGEAGSGQPATAMKDVVVKSRTAASEKLASEKPARLAKEAVDLRQKLSKGEVTQADIAALRNAAVNPNFTAPEKARIAKILANIPTAALSGMADGGTVSSNARLIVLDKRIADARARRDQPTVDRLTRTRQAMAAL